jgi:hypothetical protein
VKFTCVAGPLLIGLKPVIDVATKGVATEVETARKFYLRTESKGQALVARAHGGRLATEISIHNLNIDDFNYNCITDGEVVIDADQMRDNLSSFNEDDEIIVSASKNEFKIALKADKDQYQSLVVYDVDVQMPVLATKFDKVVEISRSMFIEGIDKIFFAIGKDKDREVFQHWALRIDGDKIRFIAGDGGFFAFLDVEGDSLVQSSINKTHILFPKDQTPVIKDILESREEEKIKIGYAVRTKTHNDQFVIDYGKNRMVLVGFDPSIQYVDEEQLLKLNKPIHVQTPVKEWATAIKGMMATYTKDYRDTHQTFVASVEFDLANEVVVLKTETPLKMSRKVPISKIIKNTDNEESVQLNCPGPVLKDIVDHSKKDSVIDFRMIANTKPVFVNHLPKNNDVTNVSRDFHMFFASLDSSDGN